MIQSVIALVAIMVLALMSWRADRQLAAAARLPMQWSLRGRVNWTAPRQTALAFTPVLASCVLGAFVVASFVLAPRPGQEREVIPAALFLALLFVAIHALHLWLVAWQMRRDFGRARRP